MRSASGERQSSLRKAWYEGALRPSFCLLLFCTSCCAQQASSLQEETQGNQEEGVSVLGVFTVMLVIGVASYHVLAFTRIPYTAILIVRLPHGPSIYFYCNV